MRWWDNPSKGYVFVCGLGGKLLNVAQPDNNPNSLALPQFGQNSEGIHERAAERSAFDKSNSTGNN